MAMLITDNRTMSLAEIDNSSFVTNMSLDISTPTTVPAQRMHPAYLVQTIFVCDHVLVPLVCSLGIVGNGLSLCVLTRREMMAATTCFLTAMAVSDLMLLVLQIPTFFGLNSELAEKHSFKSFIRFYFVVRYALNNVFITCTGWLTVAVTIERFISLRFMFHPRFVCTIPRARLAIIAIFILSFIFHFSKFFEYVPNQDLNSPINLVPTHLVKSTTYETYIHITNIALASIIPVFLLVVANSFLIYFLSTHRRRMLRHKASSTANLTSVDMIHVTAIVVATVLVFIACHAIGVFLALTIASKGKRTSVFGLPPYIALKHINNLLIFVNSSVNFLLYCAISCKFRKTFVSMIKGHLKATDTCTSAIQLSENSAGNAISIPRVTNGKIYTASTKPPITTGISHNGHNITRTDV